MKKLLVKSTTYFDPEVHEALRRSAATSQISMSALVNEAVREMMHNDQQDLAAYTQRAAESEISRNALIANLKRHGKL